MSPYESRKEQGMDRELMKLEPKLPEDYLTADPAVRIEYFQRRLEWAKLVWAKAYGQGKLATESDMAWSKAMIVFAQRELDAK
jgi:hypothetical protein